jgi:hypothetical protein
MESDLRLFAPAGSKNPRNSASYKLPSLHDLCFTDLQKPPPPSAENAGLARLLNQPVGRIVFRADAMDEIRMSDSIGARIVSVARLAVAMHLAAQRAESDADAAENQPSPLVEQVMIGGTDRRVTDDSRSTPHGRE